jgi:Meckel syndrome type 1 protein
LQQTAPVAPQQTAAPAAPAAAAATAEALPQSASAPEARRTRKAMPAAPTEADAPVPDANIRLYPEHWLANIRQMLREHRRDEALRSLDRFRKQYPDYRLPDDLRDLR